MAMECEDRWHRVDVQEQSCSMTFNTKALESFKANYIGEFITNYFSDLNNKETRHQTSRVSGWTIHKCSRLIFKMNVFSPISGSSYIDLIKQIKF